MGRVNERAAIRLAVGMAALIGMAGLARAAPAAPDQPALPAPGTDATGPISPGPAATIEITLDPISVAEGGAATSSVLVRILDSAGNLTDAKLALESALAKLGKPARLESGTFRASLLVPAGTMEDVIEITARAGQAVAKAAFSISQVATTVTITPRGPIRADDSTRGQLEVLDVAVVDAAGNPVNEAPKGSARIGEFREAIRVGPGRWALPYRPPRISEDTTVEAVVTAGAASANVTLELQAGRFAFGGGAKAGLAVAGGGLGPALSGEGVAWTHVGRHHLGLMLELSWWMRSSSSSTTVGGSPSSYQTTQYYPSLLVSAAWQTRLADRWTIWATMGLGAGLVSNHAQLDGQPAVSEQGVAPVVSGSVSGSPLLRSVPICLEARLTWIGDPGLTTMSGSSTTFLLLLGYRFDVG